MLEHEFLASIERDAIFNNRHNEVRSDYPPLSLHLTKKPTLSRVSHTGSSEEEPIDVISMPIPIKANLPVIDVYIKRKKLIIKGR